MDGWMDGEGERRGYGIRKRSSNSRFGVYIRVFSVKLLINHHIYIYVVDTNIVERGFLGGFSEKKIRWELS